MIDMDMSASGGILGSSEAIFSVQSLTSFIAALNSLLSYT